MTHATFFRLLEADDKSAALLDAIHQPQAAAGRQRFEVDPDSFASVPGSPFAYTIGERVRRIFTDVPAFEGDGRNVRCGMGTLDDTRFVRCWWEVRVDDLCVESRNGAWTNYAKGGVPAPFYTPLPMVVNYGDDGREVKSFVEAKVGSVSRKIQAQSFYRRPGITFGRRIRRLSPAVYPSEVIFSDSSNAMFFAGDTPELLHQYCGLLNAALVRDLFSLFAPVRKMEVGFLQRLSVPFLDDHRTTVAAKYRLAIESLARRGWFLRRFFDTVQPTSHAFTLPAILQAIGETLNARAAAWAERVRNVEAELAAIQAEIDERCFDLYGIDEADRRAIREGFSSSVAAESTDEAGAEETDSDDETTAEAEADAASLVTELLSWAVGVAFGRFDQRLATGERELPPEPEPFDPLPICSPGMLAEESSGQSVAGSEQKRDVLPVTRDTLPPGYPIDIPWSGCIVDDPGHPLDIEARVHDVLKIIWSDRRESIEHEACEMLGLKSLRDYFRKTTLFFAEHFKRYSKSRRKAPIYWQLATPLASYSVWLYYHRFTRDTFFQVLNEYVKPKLDHERQKLDRLRGEAGSEPTRSQRKEIEDQEKFVAELASMTEEVERIAPLWNPNLNDGVIINFAPLWRLVPQNKSWQKECKSCWDKLVKGDYDWAHLAMHFWPERVVPKCVTDASLAIAHGLEDAFWQQDDRDRFQPKEKPAGGWQPVIQELVEERTSPAVKAALKSLLEAPASVSGTKRRTRKRASS